MEFESYKELGKMSAQTDALVKEINQELKIGQNKFLAKRGCYTEICPTFLRVRKQTHDKKLKIVLSDKYFNIDQNTADQVLREFFNWSISANNDMLCAGLCHLRANLFAVNDDETMEGALITDDFNY
jgi:hypothetical protein